MDPKIQFWLEVGKALATLLAAGVAAYVAWRIGSSQRDIARQQADTAAEQKRIAAAKLNLELFEERYALFEKVRSFLCRSTGINDAKTVWDWDLPDLIPKAQFLFGTEITDYMREVHQKRQRLMRTYLVVEKRDGPISGEESALVLELEKWISSEISNCFKRFGPYLDFSAWKA